jgi:tellurite resistance protein
VVQVDTWRWLHHALPVITTRARLTPNLFGLPFGLAGLAQCWQVAHVSGPVTDVLWVVAAIAWLTVAVLYLGSGSRLADLDHPVLSPFTALLAIVPMVLAGGLAVHSHTAGVVVYSISLVATVLFGGWLTGGWILGAFELGQWHPGYFLPTAAGGLLAAGGAAGLGLHRLALVMFGYGVVCWLTLGSIILLRLFTQQSLPPPLLPTMAIEVAPPVVAGNAWFVINGGRLDWVVFALTGYGALMVLVQLRLIPAYRRAPFGVGTWAFSFSYAAVFTFAVHWVRADGVAGERSLTYVLLAVISVAIAALLTRTGLALRAGRFLPAAPPAAPAPEHAPAAPAPK